MARDGDFRQGPNHLPPGHEPGPQSRRTAHGAPVGYMFLAAASLGFVVGAIVLFAGAAHYKSPSGARVGAAIFVVGALTSTTTSSRRSTPRTAPTSSAF